MKSRLTSRWHAAADREIQRKDILTAVSVTHVAVIAARATYLQTLIEHRDAIDALLRVNDGS